MTSYKIRAILNGPFYEWWLAFMCLVGLVNNIVYLCIVIFHEISQMADSSKI